jgi:CheY-like chemotaxis protein
LEKLSIDYAVFPDVTTANKVKALFTFPKANNVKMFHQTKHKLISIRVQYENEVLLHVGQFITEKVIIVGIERDKEFFVPTMETSIFQNDLVYLFGSIEAIEPIAFRLDEKMPVMSGKSFLAELRKKKFDMPVIILTGSLQPGQIKSLDKSLFQEIFIKPVRLGELLKTLKKYLPGKDKL